MSPEHTVPSINIFGGEYNAKGVELADVAETFVPPMPVFRKLVQQNNTLLIGPRGSGKTTLLKMLQGPALELWPHQRAQEFRDSIRYSGVFVPADQTWAAQLRAKTLDALTVRQFAISTFTLHCLRALVRTASERTRSPSTDTTPHRRVMLDGSAQLNIAQEVGREWSVGRPVSDLSDLRVALTDSIRRLGALRSEEVHRRDRGRADRLAAEPLLHLELIPAALSFVERFNEACGEHEGRWAFLFDEIELVPRGIEDLVLGLLRGTDERFLFKVSYAPYERDHAPGEDGSPLSRPLGPQAAQDYTILRLTYANKREGFPFSEDLLRAELKRHDLQLSPTELLGETTLVADDPDTDGSDSPPPSAYAPAAPAGQLLAELERIDASLRAYLKKHGFELSGIPAMPEDQRARLRKIMPLVALRVEYRRRDPATGQTGLRGRRNVTLYSGADAFFAMMEANPRWLKHVADRLLEDAQAKVPQEKQSRILREAAEEFTGYLRVLPMHGTHIELDDAPKRLLERIASYFRAGYLRSEFDPDPAGSLRIDREFSEQVMNALRALINRGALIQVPDRTDPGLGSVTDKRFRLAYLVAPLYGLPLRLDKAAPLSEILSSRPGGQLTIEELG